MNTPAPRTPHSAFWPMFLLVLCFGTLVTHQLIFAVRQYLDGTRLREQQITIMRQAADAEQKMTAMMVDLLVLSKTDPQAKAIVENYRIQYNAPVPGTAAATPTPPPAAQPPAAQPTAAPNTTAAPAAPKPAQP